MSLKPQPLNRTEIPKQTHVLKCQSKYFQKSWINAKNFEIRKNDRDFKVGDHIILREFLVSEDKFSGRELTVLITYIFDDFGLQDDFIVLATQILAHKQAYIKLDV